jgi:hypothetical protein
MVQSVESTERQAAHRRRTELLRKVMDTATAASFLDRGARNRQCIGMCADVDVWRMELERLRRADDLPVYASGVPLAQTVLNLLQAEQPRAWAASDRGMQIEHAGRKLRWRLTAQEAHDVRRAARLAVNMALLELEEAVRHAAVVFESSTDTGSVMGPAECRLAAANVRLAREHATGLRDLAVREGVLTADEIEVPE